MFLVKFWMGKLLSDEISGKLALKFSSLSGVVWVLALAVADLEAEPSG